jgi:hypothetical protein
LGAGCLQRAMPFRPPANDKIVRFDPQATFKLSRLLRSDILANSSNPGPPQLLADPAARLCPDYDTRLPHAEPELSEPCTSGDPLVCCITEGGMLSFHKIGWVVSSQYLLP